MAKYTVERSYREYDCPPCPTPKCDCGGKCSSCNNGSCDAAYGIGALGGAATGATVGSLICPGVGTAIGAVLGWLGGAAAVGGTCELLSKADKH